MTAVRHGAIIGFGNVALHGHLPGWRARSDFSIVAVADADAQRRRLAEEKIPGVRTYADAAEVLRRERLDFVDIAAPPAVHGPVIAAAAAAGVHVLCEKPFMTSWPEYRTVRTAVQRANIVLHTVHNWKYSEAFRTAERALAAGQLGALRAIRFETARNGCAATTGDNWRVQAAVAGGGILVDHGWHVFYLLLALARAFPQRLRAVLERRRYTEAEVEDTAEVAVDFPSLAAEIRLTWAAAERRTRWQLVGDGGSLSIDDDAVRLRRREGEESWRLATSLSASSHHPDWFAGVLDSFRNELDNPAARGTNQAEAEWCLLLLHLAYASAAQRSRPLDIPPPSHWFAPERASR